MCDNYKKRVPNFTAGETELLTNLVRKYANVLECKKTDVVNNKLKEETWVMLSSDFNSASAVCTRDAKTLSAKYENIKKTLKKKYGTYRRSFYGTGGGPPQDIKLTSEEEIVMEIAGPSIEGLPSRYDGDELSQNLEPPIVKMPLVLDNIITPEEFEFDASTSGQGNKLITEEKEQTVEIKETPQTFLLRKRKATPLRRQPETFKKTMSDYSTLAMKKMELIDAQINSINEKLSMERKEHEVRLEILKIDLEIKRQMLN